MRTAALDMRGATAARRLGEPVPLRGRDHGNAEGRDMPFPGGYGTGSMASRNATNLNQFEWLSPRFGITLKENLTPRTQGGSGAYPPFFSGKLRPPCPREGPNRPPGSPPGRLGRQRPSRLEKASDSDVDETNEGPIGPPHRPRGRLRCVDSLRAVSSRAAAGASCRRPRRPHPSYRRPRAPCHPPQSPLRPRA